jgi:hypothetical protein
MTVRYEVEDNCSMISNFNRPHELQSWQAAAVSVAAGALPGTMHPRVQGARTR